MTYIELAESAMLDLVAPFPLVSLCHVKRLTYKDGLEVMLFGGPPGGEMYGCVHHFASAPKKQLVHDVTATAVWLQNL